MVKCDFRALLALARAAGDVAIRMRMRAPDNRMIFTRIDTWHHALFDICTWPPRNFEVHLHRELIIARHGEPIVYRG